MARIVEIKDKAPLVIRKDEIQGDATYVCRCGLSMQWPMCDGTHKQTTREPTDTLVIYTRDASGALQRRDASGIRPGEADPRAGATPQVPTPGTEAQAAEGSEATG